MGRARRRLFYAGMPGLFLKLAPLAATLCMGLSFY
jgi:hypothetical protein